MEKLLDKYFKFGFIFYLFIDFFFLDVGRL